MLYALSCRNKLVTTSFVSKPIICHIPHMQKAHTIPFVAFSCSYCSAARSCRHCKAANLRMDSQAKCSISVLCPVYTPAVCSSLQLHSDFVHVAWIRLYDVVRCRTCCTSPGTCCITTYYNCLVGVPWFHHFLTVPSSSIASLEPNKPRSCTAVN